MKSPVRPRTRALAVFAFASLVAQSIWAQTPPLSLQTKVEQVVENYGGTIDDGIPPHTNDEIEVRLVPGTDTGALASIQQKPDGTGWLLIVYPDQFGDTYPDPEGGDGGGLEGDAGVGRLGPTIDHELKHKCKGDGGDSDGYSCNHFLIDYSTALGACEVIAELNGLIGAETPGTSDYAALTAKRDGMCEAHKRIMDVWNSDHGRQRAADCYREKDDDWTGVESGGCGLIKPPPAPAPTPPENPDTFPPYPSGPIPGCPGCP